MKIMLIGASAAGKTTLTKRLSTTKHRRLNMSGILLILPVNICNREVIGGL